MNAILLCSLPHAGDITTNHRDVPAFRHDEYEHGDPVETGGCLVLFFSQAVASHL